MLSLFYSNFHWNFDTNEESLLQKSNNHPYKTNEVETLINRNYISKMNAIDFRETSVRNKFGHESLTETQNTLKTKWKKGFFQVNFIGIHSRNCTNNLAYELYVHQSQNTKQNWFETTNEQWFDLLKCQPNNEIIYKIEARSGYVMVCVCC